MQLSSSVNNGLVEELNRLCGTTATLYPFKDKVADLNSALDWYFDLAERAGMNWNADDTNQASPPIDTQNIVSGTNRYKLSSFTEEISELLKLEVNGSSGNAVALTPETLDEFGNVQGNASGQISRYGSGSFDEIYVNAASGVPTHYIKYANFIYLRPKPNYSATSGLKAYFNRPASKFSFVAFTITIASPGVVTKTAHGLSNGDTVILETDGALPTGLSVDTQYYVVNKADDTFQLSATSGGSAINTSGSQSGNHAFLKTNKSPGINSMHHPFLAHKAASVFMGFNNTGGVYNARLSTILPMVQEAGMKIGSYFARRDKDLRKRLTAKYQDNT